MRTFRCIVSFSRIKGSQAHQADASDRTFLQHLGRPFSGECYVNHKNLTYATRLGMLVSTVPRLPNSCWAAAEGQGSASHEKP